MVRPMSSLNCVGDYAALDECVVDFYSVQSTSSLLPSRQRTCECSKWTKRFFEDADDDFGVATINYQSVRWNVSTWC